MHKLRRSNLKSRSYATCTHSIIAGNRIGEHTYLHTCIHTYTHTHMYIYIYIYIYIRTHTHQSRRSSLKLRSCPTSYVHTHTHSHTHTHIYTHTHTSIAQIEPEIALMSNLHTLIIAGNRIEEIPEAVLGLTSLKRLNVNQNRLTLLPYEIGVMTWLTVLKVMYVCVYVMHVCMYIYIHARVHILLQNRLYALPYEIGGMTWLAVLNVMYVCVYVVHVFMYACFVTKIGCMCSHMGLVAGCAQGTLCVCTCVCVCLCVCVCFYVCT
jgi:Leucine-rich repeat (LRR) protein